MGLLQEAVPYGSGDGNFLVENFEGPKLRWIYDCFHRGTILRIGNMTKLVRFIRKIPNMKPIKICRRK